MCSAAEVVLPPEETLIILLAREPSRQLEKKVVFSGPLLVVGARREENGTWNSVLRGSVFSHYFSWDVGHANYIIAINCLLDI